MMLQGTPLLFLSLFFFLSLPSFTSAIYETQYGVNEWHTKYVGEVEKMAAGPLDQTVFLLSKTHLASVRPETGELVFRKQLPVGFNNPRLLVSFKHRVISVVEGEGAIYVSVWDAREGFLLWDKVLLKSRENQHGAKEELEMDLMVWSNFKFLFLLRFDDGVHTFAQDGEFGWTWQPPVDASIVKVLRNGYQTICITKKDNIDNNDHITYEVVSLDSANGRVMHTSDPITIPSSSSLSSSDIPFTEELFFLLHTPESSSSPHLASFPLKTPSAPPSQLLPLSPLFPSSSPSSPSPQIVSFTRVWPYSIIILEFVESSTQFHYSAVLHSPHHPMEEVWRFQTTHRLSFSSSSTGVMGWDEERPKEKEGKRLHEMYILTINEGSLYASSSSVVNEREVTTRTIMAHAPTPAQLENIQIFQDKFVLALAEDNTLFGFDLSSAPPHPLPTPCFWVREESLAGIVDSAFADFPHVNVRPEAEDVGEFAIEYVEYLYQKVQFLLNQDQQKMQQKMWEMADSVLADLPSLSPLSRSSLSENYQFYSHLFSSSSSSSSSSPSDTYGFSKVILVTTTSGKLLALSSLSGSPLWSHYVGPSVTFSSLVTFRPAPHQPFQATVAYTHSPSSSSSSPSSSVLTIDAFTGEVISLIHVDYEIKSLELLPHFAPSPTSPPPSPDSPPLFITVTPSGTIRPFPPASHSLSSHSLTSLTLQQKASSLFLHKVDDENVAISGYRYTWDENIGGLLPEETWRVVLGTRGEDKFEGVLTSRAGHVNTHEGLPSPFFVGDMEYTPYMDPNVVYAVTSVVKGAGGERREGAVGVYAIDGITGNVIFQTFHAGGAGPVRMVRESNWLCYHFWNGRGGRNEVGVLELVSPPPNPTRPAVMGLHKSFILDFDVQGMGVSKTLYGATSKDILFTSNGVVIGLVQSILSARRPAPENYTQAHREQMIMPYDPRIALLPQHVLSANRTIFGAKSVTTAASHMESSSLVFISGHDTFFTIVTPSKAFDLLESDFNYLGLVGTVVAALVLVVVFRGLAVGKELKNQWK